MCNSCASLAGRVLCFIVCFILLVIAPLQRFPDSVAVERNKEESRRMRKGNKEEELSRGRKKNGKE